MHQPTLHPTVRKHGPSQIFNDKKLAFLDLHNLVQNINRRYDHFIGGQGVVYLCE